MKRRYIYILILTMAVCLNACGKPKKAADTSSDNKKETVSQTASLGETEMPGATKSSVTEDDTENDLPMIEFEKTAEKPEEGTAAPNWSQDVTAKPTEPSKKPTEPTENPTENPTEPTPEPAEKPIELPFAPINQKRCEIMTENNRTIPFNIKLADVVIRIEPMFDYVREYCREYITTEQAAFAVRTETADIAFERERSARSAEREGRKDCPAFDAYLETLAVYRQIAEQLCMRDILLFHGSAIAVDGIGYLFTAKSGTGKSTHTRLWRELFGSRAVMVNDDKPLLKITESGVTVYGTPWNGKHRISTNIAVPLKAVCVLDRSEENHIEEMKATQAYQMLLQQSYRPLVKESVVRSLQLIDVMKKNIRFYKLGCNMNPKAARVAFEGMNGERMNLT